MNDSRLSNPEQHHIKPAEVLTAVLAILYPFLTILQGLDFTDMGFCLFRYQTFFNPDLALPAFGTFLTELTGGVWDKISPVSGVIGYKLLFALTALLTQMITWLSLKTVVPRKILLPGILLATLVITPEMQWHNYNSFSSLLFCCSGFFLLRAAQKPAFTPYFFSALFLGLTASARIPNILGFLLLLIPLAATFNKEERNSWLKPTAGVVAGTLAAAGALFLLYLATGKLTGLNEAFNRIIHSTTAAGGKHSIVHLFVKQIAGYGKAILSAGVMYLLLILSYKISGKVPEGKKRSLLVPGLTMIILLLLFYLPMHLIEVKIGKTIVTYPIFMLSALFMIILPVFWKNRANWRSCVTIAIATGIMMLISQGSDRGLKNAIYGMWLIIPLALNQFLHFKPRMKRFSDHKLFGSASYSILAIILVLTFTHSLTFVYRDSSCRGAMRYGLDHPRLQAVYTTRERAAAVNSLTKELDRKKIQGKTLLSYECLPLIHYLYDTRPYLKRPWVMLMSAEEISKRLAAAENEHEKLPPVLRAKFQPRKWSWPIPPQGLKPGAQRKKNHKQRLVLDGFLKRHGYRKTWDNGYFEIFRQPAAQRSTR